MAKINWQFVWGLITSHDFARRVYTARKWDYFLEDGTFKLRDLGLISGDTLKSEWENNFPVTRKSIFLARDIIKMNNMKLVTKRSKFWNLIRGYLLEYPRPTANDVWFRDYKAEEEEHYRRSACCMPYDCMHYENETGRLEIWNKAQEVGL